MFPLSAAVLLWTAGAAGAAPAADQLNRATNPCAAATAEASKTCANAPFDGRAPGDGTVVDGRDAKGRPRLRPATPAEQTPGTDVPAVDHDARGGMSTQWMMIGAGALGALQGWFTSPGGLAGAAAGAGLALIAGWLFHKGDYGAAGGVMAGSILGAALGGGFGIFGGPLGALAGGLIGHFIGKLF